MWKIMRRAGIREPWTTVAVDTYEALKSRFDEMRESLDLDHQIMLIKAGL